MQPQSHVENAFNDPVLGPCEMLPMRHGPGIFWGLCFLAMAIAFPIVVLLWLTDPGLHLDSRLIVLAVVATLFMPFSAWGQLKAMRSPYYLIVGPQGFATSSSGAVLWRDVAAINPRTLRGKTVGLAVLLKKPRKASLAQRVNSLFGLLQSWDASKVVSLPKSLTYIPLDELEVLLSKYREASGPVAGGLGAGTGDIDAQSQAPAVGDASQRSGPAGVEAR